MIAGVPGYPQDWYYSLPREPEQFSPLYVLREPDDYGSPIVAGGVANDRFISFSLNSIWRHDNLPFVTDPGFGLGIASRQKVTLDHGCIAKRSVVNFGVTQSNN